MDNLKLVFPSEEHEQKAIEYINEFIEYNSENNGTGGLDRYVDDYLAWLEKLHNELNKINIEKGRVPASTFFAIRASDNKIVGMINIRHELNDNLLRKGGHIGYGVRPTERRKGYVTKILYLGIKEAKKLGLEKLLLTSDKSNIGSVKAIQKNWGVLENEFQEEDEIIQRYWIDVNEALNKGIKTNK